MCTEFELRVVKMLLMGYDRKEIGNRFGLSYAVICRRVSEIGRKVVIALKGEGYVGFRD